MALKIYKPTDSCNELHPNAKYYKALSDDTLADIFKYDPGYIEYAIETYADFAIDMIAFEKLPRPTPVYYFRSGQYEKGFSKLYRKRLKWPTAMEEDRDIKAWEDDCRKYLSKIRSTGIKLEEIDSFNMPQRPEPDRIPSAMPWGYELLSLVRKYKSQENYQPPQDSFFEFSYGAKDINEKKIDDADDELDIIKEEEDIPFDEDDDRDYEATDSRYYNDNLDTNQQSQEFWDNIEGRKY